MRFSGTNRCIGNFHGNVSFFSFRHSGSGGSNRGKCQAERCPIKVALFSFSGSRQSALLFHRRLLSLGRIITTADNDFLLKFSNTDLAFMCVLRGTAYISRRDPVWPRALYHATHPSTFLPYLYKAETFLWSERRSPTQSGERGASH